MILDLRFQLWAEIFSMNKKSGNLLKYVYKQSRNTERSVERRRKQYENVKNRMAIKTKLRGTN